MKSLRLNDRIFLREFEDKLIYNAEEDELYEIDNEAFEFFLECNGEHSYEELRKKYGREVDYAISEGLVVESNRKLKIFIPSSPSPSLRYILIHITRRCNLRCLHCYVDKKGVDMDTNIFGRVIDEFFEIGGIKVMITGGEPLIHPEIENFLRIVGNYGIRVELLTNGTAINEKNASLIRKYVDEVQVSIDGVNGHDMLRGEGSLEKTLNGLKLIEGVDLSVATMITEFNKDEFDRIEEIVRNLNAKRWLLDYPCTDVKILPSFSEAAEIMNNYGFGRESYVSSLRKTCGAHLCAVTPEGFVSKCGFYEKQAVGSIFDGLRECWRRICEKQLWNLVELECDCEVMDECKGGCRYRAEFFGNGSLGKDPFMCSYFGITE